MSPLDDLLPFNVGPVDDGIDVFEELTAAVAWLRRGAIPGLTVWDAIEEALRLRLGFPTPWSERDPLGAILIATIHSDPSVTAANSIAAALRGWLAATNQVFNEGSHW